MRTQKEIEQEIEKICKLEGELRGVLPYNIADGAAQALAWVLGDGMSASEYVKDLKDIKSDE